MESAEPSGQLRGLPELQLDQVADHQVVAAAQHARRRRRRRARG